MARILNVFCALGLPPPITDRMVKPLLRSQSIGVLACELGLARNQLQHTAAFACLMIVPSALDQIDATANLYCRSAIHP